jgi:hypothetical protein
MYLADIPASVTVTNLLTGDLYIADLRIPGSGSRVINFSNIGLARKSDLWQAITHAVNVGLATTTTTTSELVDAWYSAHHYANKPVALHLGIGGHDDPLGSGTHVTVIQPGQGENLPGPVVVLPYTPSMVFSDARNSQYLILFEDF